YSSNYHKMKKLILTFFSCCLIFAISCNRENSIQQNESIDSKVLTPFYIEPTPAKDTSEQPIPIELTPAQQKASSEYFQKLQQEVMQETEFNPIRDVRATPYEEIHRGR